MAIYSYRGTSPKITFMCGIGWGGRKLSCNMSKTMQGSTVGPKTKVGVDR